MAQSSQIKHRKKRNVAKYKSMLENIHEAKLLQPITAFDEG